MKKKQTFKKLNKNYNKLKIPSTSNKAYRKLIKNISMFSLDSPNHGLTHCKTVTSCKSHTNKRIDISKKKKKATGNIR